MTQTPKQKEKQMRQFYINFLERIAKKLFKMFRDDKCTEQKFIQAYQKRLKKIEPYEKTAVHSAYHKQLSRFVQKIARDIQNPKFELDPIRGASMTHLNRLQKLKNQSMYKREKYKDSGKDG